MPTTRTSTDIRLANHSTGDPVLFVDYPGKNDAFLFDAGNVSSIPPKRLADLQAMFLSHHHIDHTCALDAVLRANLDCDKTLHIFGPVGTITKVHRRITSYEHPYFPFMKIVFEVHDVQSGRIDSARLECEKRFPPPEATSCDWDGPVLFETDELRFEAAFADHTVPCLAYVLVEKSGYRPDPHKLAHGSLRPGRWVSDALDRLRRGDDPATVLEINGGRFALSSLAEQFFIHGEETRIAFVTDTAWSRSSKGPLVRLAKGATRLYCDSYYAYAQLKQAKEHHHMTARFAAEFAVRANVRELILIHFAARYAGRYEELVAEARAIFPATSADIPTERSSSDGR